MITRRTTVWLPVVVGVVFVVLAVSMFRRRAQPPADFHRLRGLSSISPGDPWPNKMEKFAEQAIIDSWTRFKIPLDFSPNSIAQLDRVLDNTSKVPAFRHSSEKDKRAEALIAGAYVGEVIRRHHGGTWDVDSDVVGKSTFPLTLSNHTIFPYLWCVNRLENGPEDNVWHKYLILVRGETNAVRFAATYQTNPPRVLTNK